MQHGGSRFKQTQSQEEVKLFHANHLSPTTWWSWCTILEFWLDSNPSVVLYCSGWDALQRIIPITVRSCWHSPPHVRHGTFLSRPQYHLPSRGVIDPFHRIDFSFTLNLLPPLFRFQTVWSEKWHLQRGQSSMKDTCLHTKKNPTFNNFSQAKWDSKTTPTQHAMHCNPVFAISPRSHRNWLPTAISAWAVHVESPWNPRWGFLYQKMGRYHQPRFQFQYSLVFVSILFWNFDEFCRVKNLEEFSKNVAEVCIHPSIPKCKRVWIGEVFEYGCMYPVLSRPWEASQKFQVLFCPMEFLSRGFL